MVGNKQEIRKKMLENKEEILGFGVRRVGLFGSFVRNEQTNESDVDLLVDFFPEKKTYRNLIDFADFSESVLGRKVEVLTDKGVSRFLRPYIEEEVEYVQIS